MLLRRVWGGPCPLKWLKVAAEDARKRMLDGTGGDPDQLVRLENLAARAERRLGIRLVGGGFQVAVTGRAGAVPSDARATGAILGASDWDREHLIPDPKPPLPPRVHDPMRGAPANPWRCAAPCGAPDCEGDPEAAAPLPHRNGQSAQIGIDLQSDLLARE